MKSSIVFPRGYKTAAGILFLLLWSHLAAATDIIKSQNDDRTYRYLELPNQLRVLLISDPRTEKSAASLDVNTGSRDDPAERPGLAHFLEHMLFLGTQKYPKAGEYQAFISAHGGNHNAYTSLEHTNYFFDIDPQFLDEALDRFSRFFIDPLFDKQLVDRERNAVHSEYMAKIKDEGRRQWDAMREIANPQSSQFRFSVGSKDTLADRPGDAVRDDLLAFYREHYAARRMTLVVLGKEDLNVLEQKVRARFEAVPDRDVMQEEKAVPLFTAGSLPARLQVRPLQEQRELELLFPVPPYEHWYREKPVEYIGHLLGHEGRGSLFQVLRDRGWIESLAAGASISSSESAAFTISMQLTREGFRKTNEIIPMVFAFIRQLEDDGIEKWRYNEQAVVQESLFRYQEKGDPVDYVATLANNLHYYEAGDVITGGLLMRAFDEKLIREYLAAMRPDNVLVMINAPELQTHQQSRYYQTGYNVEPIPDAEQASWKKAMADKSLKLPRPNEFVAKNFNLKHERSQAVADVKSDAPELLRDQPNLKLWFKADKEFLVPRGSINVSLRNAKTAESPAGRAHTVLLARLLDNQLNEHRYTASLAGLDVVLMPGDRGMSLMIGGYNDKQGLLLTRTLEAMAAPAFAEADFARIQEEYLRQLQNEDRATPYRQWSAAIGTLLGVRNHERAVRIEAAKAVTLKSLQAFTREWLRGLQATVLVHGNYTSSDALKLAAIISRKLSLDGKAHETVADLQLQLPPVSQGYLYHWLAQHPDTAVVHYVQGADTGVVEDAHMRLLAQLIEADFYTRLRTQQQLGYVVYGTFAPRLQVPGLAFVVQSPTYSAQHIDESISAYLKTAVRELEKMPADDFEKHRQALLINLVEKPKNQGEVAERLWSDILLRRLDFTYREQVIAAVTGISQPELVNWYKNTLLAPAVRKAVIIVSQKEVSDKTLLEKYTRISDVAAFKIDKEYFVLE